MCLVCHTCLASVRIAAVLVGVASRISSKQYVASLCRSHQAFLCFVSVYVENLYSSIDTAKSWKHFNFILSERPGRGQNAWSLRYSPIGVPIYKLKLAKQVLPGGMPLWPDKSLTIKGQKKVWGVTTKLLIDLCSQFCSPQFRFHSIFFTCSSPTSRIIFPFHSHEPNKGIDSSSKILQISRWTFPKWLQFPLRAPSKSQSRTSQPSLSINFLCCASHLQPVSSYQWSPGPPQTRVFSDAQIIWHWVQWLTILCETFVTSRTTLRSVLTISSANV